MLLEGVGQGDRAPPLRNLEDQLTLFKPWGVDYAHHTTIQNPIYSLQSTPLYFLIVQKTSLRFSLFESFLSLIQFEILP